VLAHSPRRTELPQRTPLTGLGGARSGGGALPVGFNANPAL